MSHIKIVVPPPWKNGALECYPTLGRKDPSNDTRPDSEKILVTFVADDKSEHDLGRLISEIEVVIKANSWTQAKVTFVDPLIEIQTRCQPEASRFILRAKDLQAERIDKKQLGHSADLRVKDLQAGRIAGRDLRPLEPRRDEAGNVMTDHEGHILAPDDGT